MNARLAVTAAALLLAGCGAAQSASISGDQAWSTIRSGGTVDYATLNCPALTYLVQKYDSIADSALSLNTDNAALQLQGLQATQQAIDILGVMGRKGCDIPDLN